MKKLLVTGLLIVNLCFLSQTHIVEAKNGQEADRKVILLSFDGMKHDYTNKYVKENKLPHIKGLRDKGVWAKHPITITPSLTAPSHAAIATGATPHQTGIVSNQWHDQNKPLENKDDGFQAEIQVPPLWVEARKQGKTTATIAFPGANPKNGKQGDYSIYYGKTWSSSALESLTFKNTSEWMEPPKSFSPLKDAAFSINMKNENNRLIHILAIDSTDDQKQNYDTFLLSEDKVTNQDDTLIKGKQWGSLSLHTKDQITGFWFKMKSDNPDLNSPIQMYRTAVTSGFISGPQGFSNNIQKQFGFLPVQDDDIAFEKGWISRKEYQDISSRFVMWVTNVSLYIKQKYNPDLLMFYAPQIDHEQHKYLLIDPRQPGYSSEKSKKYMTYIEWSYRLADKVVGETLNSLNENDDLFIVSDHGMEPAHSTLSPNKVLKDAGLLTVDKHNQVNYQESKAYAIPSGSTAHVYINLKNREKDGIVPPKEYEKIRTQIIQLFKGIEIEKRKRSVVPYNRKERMFSFYYLLENVHDPWKYLFDRKVHPFEHVMKNTNDTKPFLGHPHSGDVVLVGAPGYVIGSGTTKIVSPPIELGTHGGDPARSMLRPVFMAIGSDIHKGTYRKKMSNLDIAPTIYDLLELEPPSFVEGKKIKGIFKRDEAQ